jgi:hypothetical protein
MKSICVAMINYLRACLAAVVMLPAAGCYFPYPSSWPQIEQSTEIETQIEGSFLCSGEIKTSNTGFSDKRSLADFLIGIERKYQTSCEYVEIHRIQPDEIEVRFMKSDGEFLRQNYKKNIDYRLDGNWIVLRSRGACLAEDIVAFYASESPHITIDSEHDLIVKVNNSGFGTCFCVIPAVSLGNDWGRFKRKQ